MNEQSTTVILRECGERTADHTYRFLCDAFSPEQVFRISKSPFSEALRASLELGIKEDRKFVLCVDADVLPFANAFQTLIQEMENLPAHVPEVQGMVFDNLFRIWRPAGNHLYRTSILHKALKVIPSEGASLRPESDMLSALVRRGNPWLQSRSKIGIHDYAQNFEDIYRKAFLGAIKHKEFRPYLNVLWPFLAASSDTFKVASEALDKAVHHHGSIAVDKNFMADETKDVLNRLGLKNQTDDDVDFDRVAIENVDTRLPGHVSQLRLACQNKIHHNLFNKIQSRIRIIMSSKIFGIFSS